jgi:hypothetical protein
VNAEPPYALHLELESSAALGMPERLLRYNVNAWAANGLPIHSVVVLLRPKASASDLNGELTRFGVNGREIHHFRYDVFRVWQEPVDGLIASLGMAPLAVLADEATADLPATLDCLGERLRATDVDDTLKDIMLGASYVLGGLRYDLDTLKDFYRRLPMLNLEDSVTYQDLIKQGMEKGVVRGHVEALRGQLLRLGAKKFGRPDAATAARVEGITAPVEFERLSDRLLDVTTWAELFADA